MHAPARDFAALRAAMQRHVDGEILAGVSWAVLRDGVLVDQQCVGHADREAGTPLREDHIFRAFSNTKLVTTCAVMLLVEEGQIALDDPVEKVLPQLGNRTVLRPDATGLADTEPARSPITIRHLLTHSSGLSYGFFDPGSMIFMAYGRAGVHDPKTTLADMVDRLAGLPLIYHPGTSWDYSIATDVLGRLVEVVSGMSLDAFFQSRIFAPLGMTDTGFFVAEARHDRLVPFYRGADVTDPTKPGLWAIEDRPADLYRTAYARQSGGGGLVTTLPDMLALIRALLPGSDRLLKPDTLRQMMTNQLPEGQTIRFATLGPVPSKGFGLGGSVTLRPGPFDPPDSTGEFQWGGVAGTHWWIHPGNGTAGVLMAQRYMSFWNPYYFEFKRLLAEAMKAG